MDDLSKAIELVKKLHNLYLSETNGKVPDDVERIFSMTYRLMQNINSLSQDGFKNVDIKEIMPLATNSLQNLHSFIAKEVDPKLNLILKEGFNEKRKKIFFGLYTRIFYHLKSLLKLNNPEDLQAINSLNRCLLEINTDLIVLRNGDEDIINKYDAFIFVDRYDKIKKLLNLIVKNTVPMIDISEPKAYINDPDNKKKYQDYLSKYWKNKHPKNWHKNSIFDCFMEAKKIEKSSSVLTEYRILYPRYSWFVHSGLSGLESLNYEFTDDSIAGDLMIGSLTIASSIGIVCEEFELGISVDDLKVIAFSNFLEYFLNKGPY